MNTLPYVIVSNNEKTHEGRIGFDAAALLYPGSILTIDAGRFVVLKTELDIRGPEAHLLVFVGTHKFDLVEFANPLTVPTDEHVRNNHSTSSGFIPMSMLRERARFR